MLAPSCICRGAMLAPLPSLSRIRYPPTLSGRFQHCHRNQGSHIKIFLQNVSLNLPSQPTANRFCRQIHPRLTLHINQRQYRILARNIGPGESHISLHQLRQLARFHHFLDFRINPLRHDSGAANLESQKIATSATPPVQQLSTPSKSETAFSSRDRTSHPGVLIQIPGK